MHPAEPFLDNDWLARLELGFDWSGSGTRLARRRHVGPLRVQKPFYPEGADVCHVLLLHPPAGIAGGDRLEIDIEVAAGARALLTTPGAGKWYRSAGPVATQSVQLRVAPGGIAEWLPQESILFPGMQGRLATRVELAEGAQFVGVDTLCFGRRASGETFSAGAVRLACDIDFDGRPLWRERGRIDGGSPLLDSPVGLDGFSVCSTVLVAGSDIAVEVLAACRALSPREPTTRIGITARPKLLVARYLGHSAESARHWFIDLWRILRPAVSGRAAAIPRIWHT
jgi:urease accessory protein